MANELITKEHTQVMQKLVREVVNDPSTYLGSKYIPSVALPVDEIRVEIIEASGGLTQEHIPGTDPKYIQSFGTRVQNFRAPKYKEVIHYDENKLLYLRKLGQNDPSMRGVRQYIDLDVDRLNRRLEARIEKQRWDAIFSGGYSFMGETMSFGVPSANKATPVGAKWSLDGINANNSANPIQDIRYWLEGGYGAFRKYVVTKIIMNPNTARWILDNSNTRSYVQNMMANPAVSQYDVNSVLRLFMPGAPSVEIYRGWYQNESADSTGKLVVTDAIYMIPDGQIFFEVSLPGGDMIGEFVQGIQLAEGTIDAPGVGKFLVVEDNTAPGTKGGPKNPFIDIVAGVYGGVKLDRAFDLLTANVL